VLIAVFLVSACQPTEPTLSPEQIAQSVASTQQAAATQQFVQTLIAKLDQLSNQPTWTPMPTYTPYPTPTIPPAPTAVIGTTTPTARPTEVYGGKCYQMEFLGDVNYPPDSIVKPGATFTKQWKVKNTGTCEWKIDFDIVWVGGDKIGGNGDITYVIKPGDTVILSVPITAPMKTGTYTGYWEVKNLEGYRSVWRHRRIQSRCKNSSSQLTHRVKILDQAIISMAFFDFGTNPIYRKRLIINYRCHYLRSEI